MAQKFGAERQINDISTGLHSAYSITNPNGGFLAIYSTTVAIYGKFYFKDPACTDVINYLAYTTPITIDFKLAKSMSVYPKTLPTNGTLKTSTNTVLVVSTQYDIKLVTYTFTTAKADSFTFVTNTVDAACKVSFALCYSSCGDCDGVGDSTDHKCTSCYTTGGYYPLADNNRKCYNNVSPPAGYYFASTIWNKCHTLCKQCTDAPTDVDMMCVSNSCITGYYPKSDNMTSCFNGSIVGYFFDGSIYQICFSSCATCSSTNYSADDHKCSQCAISFFPLENKISNCYITANHPQGYFLLNNKWMKCFNLCKDCTGYPTDSNVNMLCQSNSCIDGWYPKEENMTTCYPGDLTGYFLDPSKLLKKCNSLCETCSGTSTDNNMFCNKCIFGYYNKIDNLTSCFKGNQPQYFFDGLLYQKCYSLCQTCSNSPSNDSKDMLCNSCISGYFPKKDSMSNCFKGDIEGYYLDGNMYQTCHEFCKTCSKGPINTDMSCDICKDGYYTKEDNKTSCFNGNIDGYYFDMDSNLYKKCYTSCRGCTGYKEMLEHLCTSCINDYFPLEDKLSNCYKSSQTVDGYYFKLSKFSKCYDSCKTCKGPGTGGSPNCVECKEDQNCEACPDIYYNAECITQCPEETVFDSLGNTCYSCKEKKKIYYESSCVDTCPIGYIEDASKCVTCDTQNLVYYNGQCVSSCPSSYINNKGICVGSNYLIN
jgi:hypothetical protein